MLPGDRRPGVLPSWAVGFGALATRSPAAASVPALAAPPVPHFDPDFCLPKGSSVAARLGTSWSTKTPEPGAIFHKGKQEKWRESGLRAGSPQALVGSRMWGMPAGVGSRAAQSPSMEEGGVHLTLAAACLSAQQGQCHKGGSQLCGLRVVFLPVGGSSGH